MRGKAWSTNDLAKALSGDDPMAAIGDLVAGYWARRRQTLLFSMLKGVFAANSMSGNVKDISALTGNDCKIGGTAFVDALFEELPAGGAKARNGDQSLPLLPGLDAVEPTTGVTVGKIQTIGRVSIGRDAG